MLSRFRKPVDKFAPSLARLYRFLRERTSYRTSVQNARSLPTKYGFSVAGAPHMAQDGWEDKEIELLLELMESHETFLDIGANVGFYSCLAASRGKHTVAVEPSSRNLTFLYRNLWDNHFPNVEIFPLGLAASCGLGRLYGDCSMSSFVPGWGQSKAKPRLVPLATLDTIAGGRFQNKRLLIKMDVEGFEFDVLSGASETLGLNPRPTWLVEIVLNNRTFPDLIPGGINPRFAETFELFWAHGYQCRMVDSALTPVEKADVRKWVADASVDLPRDFLFSAA
ncbi:MAG: FkbM family methyltransferase [Terracidiphilus sp.]